MAVKTLTNHEILEMDLNYRWENKRPHGLKNRRRKKRNRRTAINSYVEPRFDRRCYKRRASDK